MSLKFTFKDNMNKDEQQFVSIVDRLNSECTDSRLLTDSNVLVVMNELYIYFNLKNNKKFIFYNKSRDKDGYAKMWFEA